MLIECSVRIDQLAVCDSERQYVHYGGLVLETIEVTAPPFINVTWILDRKGGIFSIEGGS